ncbi:hypothetical protein HERIO_2737 [Hepatospora eriocheir]|uniref:Uncharacterized protein n=1 Tax=Hepatospora eriocheir TaxID=1081669 RepID=A0A1X0Q6Q6_9MICR|nr:hypothetical protein HERIO_2737 [Hepatospora eriocheir]
MMLNISNLIFLILTTINIITANPISNATLGPSTNGTLASDENSFDLNYFIKILSFPL